MHKLVLNGLYKNFQEFTKDIQKFFSSSSNTIHKARNEIKIIEHEEQNLVVKSFKEPNIINKIAYSFFRDSKARKSYYYSLRLEDFAPTPISYIEFYKTALIKESYFISERFEYDFTIREPLLDASFKDRTEIFQAFARFTLELHNHGIFHQDYSPGNILIKRSKNSYIFKIVDVNRMNFFTLSIKDRARNFSKLWANDTILITMALEYQKHFSCGEDFTRDMLYFSNKNKRIKNFKKRLKGKKIHD